MASVVGTVVRMKLVPRFEMWRSGGCPTEPRSR